MPLDLNSTVTLNNSTDMLNSSTSTLANSTSLANSSTVTNPGFGTTFEVVFIIFLLPILAVMINFIVEYYKLYQKEKKK
jgi:hypothetical protein